MRDKMAVLAGGVFALILSVVAVTTVGRQYGTTAAITASILRRSTKNIRKPLNMPMIEAPQVTRDDVLVAIYVLHAQYTGRLDRMRTLADASLIELSEHTGRWGPPAGNGDARRDVDSGTA